MAANLVTATLQGGLYTRVVGRRLRYYQSLGSTMDEARRLAAEGAQEGTVVVAETQEASRGRFGRTWVSQPGNLYLSVVFYPGLAHLPLLSLLAGVAVARAVSATTGLDPRIKWPNDVMLQGRKVAGILVESVVAGPEVQHAVVGIGINVALDPATLGPLPVPAGSLEAAVGGPVPREDLLRRLLHQLDALYLALKKGESPIDEWRSLLEGLGGRLTVTQGPASGEAIAGLAEGVDDLGNLLLRLDDGRLRTLSSGDVTLSAGPRGEG